MQQNDQLLNFAEEFLTESPTPGEKRGDYEDTKLRTNQMSPKDAKKAGSDVLKKIVSRGGAGAAGAASELKKRDEKAPDKGSDDPADDPKNKEQEAEGDKETKDTEEPKSDEKLTPKEEKNKKDYKEKTDKVVDDITKEIEDNLGDVADDDEGDADDDDGEGVPVPGADDGDLDDPETANKFKKFFDDSKLGKLLKSFFDVEPAPFPGADDDKAGAMNTIKDMLIDMEAKKLDKAAGVKDNKVKDREKARSDRQKDFAKKSDKELKSIIDDPSTSSQEREDAKSIFDDPERKAQAARLKKSKEKDKPNTEDPTKDDDDDDKPNTEDPTKDDDDDDDDKPNTEDPTKKKKKKEKTEEGYRCLNSTIKEMHNAASQVGYKNLHSIIQEITHE